MMNNDTTTTRLPLLVLISGAPGTGKTTLAQHLSQTLSLPVVARDPIRDILIDAYHIQSWEQTKSLSIPAFHIYFSLLAQLLDAGISLIAECNFHRGVSEQYVRPLATKAQTVLIHCKTTHEISTQRFVERSRHPNRHHASMDAERLAQIGSGEFDAGWWAYDDPMQLDVPILIVDTSMGYAPDIDTIVDFARFPNSPDDR